MSTPSIDLILERVQELMSEMTRFEAELLTKLVNKNDYEGVREMLHVLEERYLEDDMFTPWRNSEVGDNLPPGFVEE